jgi:alkanesulfonate monooxygenase SsuD/methylene tetrahydromethanopterin reductase-like flavin-dependent oxidoreductase (luciferase family)
MKVGLILAGQYTRDRSVEACVAEMLEQVRLARQLGFDSVWMVHHYLIEFLALQPLPMLGRIAAESGEMRLGTAIYVLPLQPPVEVAENFATLDAVCGARLIFGVAQGYRDVEFKSVGVPIKERGPRLEEGIELITRLWTQDAVTFRGRYYQVDDVSTSIRPVQKPRPPIWVGATTDAGIARAARVGDAWMVGPRVGVTELGGQLARYREGLRAAGKPVEREYPIFREVVVAPSDAGAREDAERYLRAKYDAYAAWRYTESSFETLLRDAFIVGDPVRCVETIERYGAEFGITYLLARVQWPGAGQDDALRRIRLLGERVLPKLRG